VSGGKEIVSRRGSVQFGVCVRPAGVCSAGEITPEEKTAALKEKEVTYLPRRHRNTPRRSRRRREGPRHQGEPGAPEFWTGL
jgi:hypothetical protein